MALTAVSIMSVSIGVELESRRVTRYVTPLPKIAVSANAATQITFGKSI